MSKHKVLTLSPKEERRLAALDRAISAPYSQGAPTSEEIVKSAQQFERYLKTGKAVKVKNPEGHKNKRSTMAEMREHASGQD